MSASILLILVILCITYSQSHPTDYYWVTSYNYSYFNGWYQIVRLYDFPTGIRREFNIHELYKHTRPYTNYYFVICPNQWLLCSSRSYCYLNVFHQGDYSDVDFLAGRPTVDTASIHAEYVRISSSDFMAAAFPWYGLVIESRKKSRVQCDVELENLLQQRSQFEDNLHFSYSNMFDMNRMIRNLTEMNGELSMHNDATKQHLVISIVIIVGLCIVCITVSILWYLNVRNSKIYRLKQMHRYVNQRKSVQIVAQQNDMKQAIKEEGSTVNKNKAVSYWEPEKFKDILDNGQGVGNVILSDIVDEMQMEGDNNDNNDHQSCDDVIDGFAVTALAHDL